MEDELDERTIAQVAATGPAWLRRVLWLVLVLLAPVAWFSMQHDPYAIDGDAVAYMDIADLIRTHHWAGVVNAYWHPLYPAALTLGQWVFHPSRMTELAAYYRVNFAIFLLEASAVLAFTSAVCRLRDSTRDRLSDFARRTAPPYLLTTDAVRLLGLVLLTIASQRELTFGKVRPDALLQGLLLFAFSAMVTLCRPLRGTRVERAGAAPLTISLQWYFAAAALMGVALGAAYLTKSFASIVAVLSIAAVAMLQWLVLKRRLQTVLASSALTAICFAALAGPYIAALSHQKHRLDFGDSGSLNYAWYVGGTQKMHLEPWQTERFGTSTVKLVHPERQVMNSPEIYSYKAEPWGTLPVWFDASFFNERIVTHMHFGQLLQRDARNLVLVLRYLLNHPEAWLLLGLLLARGARWRGDVMGIASQSYVWLPVSLGLAMWCVYGLVNIEERYVTVAYFAVVLPLFASLCDGPPASAKDTDVMNPSAFPLQPAASIGIALLCLLALGEWVRTSAELRRLQLIRGIARGWQDSPTFAVGAALREKHVQPEAEIACVGTVACLYDPYWMRLADVRTTTEIYMDHDHVAETFAALPNRTAAYEALRKEGAPLLVGHFDPAALLASPLAREGWQRLGHTDFYALPLGEAKMPDDATAHARRQP